MRILVITVAGTASRFNQAFQTPVLKCVYYKEMVRYSLLNQLISHSAACDKVIIVGGYLFSTLKEIVSKEFGEFRNKIELVENLNYEDMGSMKSLSLGLNAAFCYNPEEIVFAEGDLYVDEFHLQNVLFSKNDVVTYNLEPILAQKAVAFYLDKQKTVKYLYDTGHKCLRIPEDFVAIYNSGQIWKFIDSNALRRINEDLSDMELSGTNLILIQKYFAEKSGSVEFVQLPIWFNCNTIDDYEKAYQTMKLQEIR